MKLNFVSSLIRLSVVILATVDIIMCTCWYPFSISLTTMGTVETIPTTMQNIELYLQLFFYWSVSVPCFVFLIYTWKLSNNIKRDAVFNVKTVKLMNRGIKILFVDLMVFVIGNLIFALIGWNDFAILYFILAAVGFAVICFLKVISHFVSKVVAWKDKTTFTSD